MQDANQALTIGVLHITIEEAKHAFRVNGVTVAKRHLVSTMTRGNDLHKKLARYLVLVPFLATAYEVAEDAPEGIKYGSIKAKRLYKALELNDDNQLPFMLFTMEQAGENIHEIGQQVREAGFYQAGNFRPFQDREDETETRSISSLPSRKPTLH